MPDSHEEVLAPCVVVAGPANSGKTSFLHQVDEALQNHPDRPEVYIVKGSPDATGRWLYHMPIEDRKRLEAQFKGVWTPEAVETICFWILSARRNLELALIDFGGKHSAFNPIILACCTHYILVARTFEDKAQEREEGMESWDVACRSAGLLPVARIRSVVAAGAAQVTASRHGEALAATYRADAANPLDSTNQSVVAAVVERLLRLRRRRGAPAYLNLRLERDWALGDLKDLAGHLPALQERACQDGRVRLGGRAPIWAYLAAMHRALDSNSNTSIEVFEPKLPGGFVRIPVEFAPRGGEFLQGCLEPTCQPFEDGTMLELRILTPERMLPSTFALVLHDIPRPTPDDLRSVVVSGVVPIWLHLAYSRLLRQIGAKRISVWDGRLQKPVQVHPPVTSQS